MPRSRYRRARHVWLSRTSWRQRLVFWVGALMVGLVAVGFAFAADMAQELSALAFERWRYIPLAASPLLFAASAWLATRYFPNSQGSGIPQAIAARHLRDQDRRRALLHPRLIVGKIGLTLLGLLGGASIGREGPTVQVGAALMLAFGNFAGLAGRRGLVLAGSAAGVAAAFNTPLAGIVFAIEEMAREFEHRTSGLVLVAVIMAGIASIAVTGNYQYFGRINVTMELGQSWIGVVLAGVVGGLAGAIFSRLVLDLGRTVPAALTRAMLQRPILFAALCGLVVAAIGVATGGLTFGTGYHAARSALEGAEGLPWWYAPAKLAATVASVISGIPGGLFAPSLSVGAGIGSALEPLVPMAPPGTIVMLGMVAYFAGVTQSPITAFVIVMEMTGNHGMLVPLMATAVLAYGLSRVVCPVSLYHALAGRYIIAGRAADTGSSLRPS